MTEEETTEAAMYLKLREDVRTLIREELWDALEDNTFMYGHRNKSYSNPATSLTGIITNAVITDTRFRANIKNVIRDALDPNRSP